MYSGRRSPACLLSLRRLTAAVVLLTALGLGALPQPLQAQTAQVQFAGLRQDSSLPVEVTADSLSVDQADGTAVFEGNVVVIQGEMRMSAARVKVDYTEARDGIEQLHATGGVVLVAAQDAAESREAIYRVGQGTVDMMGDVLLTQGTNTIAGQKLVLNMETGTGRVEGRVQTIFTPSKKSN